MQVRVIDNQFDYVVKTYVKSRRPLKVINNLLRSQRSIKSEQINYLFSRVKRKSNSI